MWSAEQCWCFMILVRLYYQNTTATEMTINSLKVEIMFEWWPHSKLTCWISLTKNSSEIVHVNSKQYALLDLYNCHIHVYAISPCWQCVGICCKYHNWMINCLLYMCILNFSTFCFMQWKCLLFNQHFTSWEMLMS